MSFPRALIPYMTRQTRASRLFLIAMGLFCLSGVATYLSFFYFRASERWVSHTQEVRAAVGDFEAAVNAAARARMGYLLSSSDSDVEAYRKAVEVIAPELKRLSTLTQDNPLQVGNVAQLTSMTASRLQTWDQAVALKQQGKAVDTTAILRQNLRLTEQSAELTEAIREEESQLLE